MFICNILSIIFYDVQLDGDTKRIVLGLYGKDCPITTNNFMLLCSGEKGYIVYD